MFPARSLQVALNTILLPSPDDVLLVVQLAESIPEPPALSAQFQVTVTSELFQPARLADGDWDGLAVGAVISEGGGGVCGARTCKVKLASFLYVPAPVSTILDTVIG